MHPGALSGIIARKSGVPESRQPDSSRNGGDAVVTFQVSTESLTVSVQHDGPTHPDLLDELSARCVQLFADTCATLVDETDDAEG